MSIYIIIITCAVSIAAFAIQPLMLRCQLNAWATVRHREYYRVFTYAFLHADWMHLLVNMFVLWSFGSGIIYSFNNVFTGNNEVRFVLLYFSAIPVSAAYSVYKHRDNPQYNAVGASGAVSAIVYVTIFLNPYDMLALWGIPIPGIVFGIVYLIYSGIMARRNVDNIGHDAHLCGAVYGFIFPAFFEPSLFVRFVKQLFFLN
ncbi:MAG: rhomboid family intramembrane serine protease [Cytophagaceae bacterium]|jgi:membrane associated rhomboid family serine protease|nr:rhomboid family intramembrane serine protease [Cytophagaceae bacterium]